MRVLLASFACIVFGAAVLSSDQRGDGQPVQPAASPRSAACAQVDAIVERAVAYVSAYGEVLGGIVATEDYRQEVLGAIETPGFIPPPITILGGVRVQPATPLTARNSVQRRLRSSFLFVQLRDDKGWVGFRDVLEVDGKAVGDRRPQTRLDVVGENALDQWRRLSEESARYNIGTITRALNVPTFALLVLHPANRSRFAFTAAGEDRTKGVHACDVAFQETHSPTIIRSGVGDDVPSSGSFRIESASGRVVRSELIAGNTAAGVGSKTSVRYERDRKLQLWVPRDMREEYIARSGERLQCVARYSDYQRVEVSFTIRPGG